MTDQINSLLASLKANTATFNDVLIFIESHYLYNPTAFKNGDVYNEDSQNQGSAKVFAFAQIHNLNEEDTLSLFAEHYHSVLAQPNAVDHQNIRQFMIHGWPGVELDGVVLTLK